MMAKERRRKRKAALLKTGKNKVGGHCGENIPCAAKALPICTRVLLGIPPDASLLLTVSFPVFPAKVDS